ANVYEEYNPSCDATIRYTVNGSTLTVTDVGNNGNSITIENFSDNRLGINVGDEYNSPNWRNKGQIIYWFDWSWFNEYDPVDEYDVSWPTAVNFYEFAGDGDAINDKEYWRDAA
ncbi:MAG: hypothetical protein AB2535_21770, partial [Candidatus Thiodiazotropha endolucinida]